MKELLDKVRQLEQSEINDLTERRLAEFASFKKKSEDEWFSELCFCILTANAKQKTSAEIQSQINAEGFKTLSQETLTNLIKLNKHRFHNIKAKYIVLARQFANIKSIIQNMPENQARDWLVQNIQGIGMKEASHFIRNTGGQNLAILDRHILNILVDQKIILKPKNLNIQKYKEIEQVFVNIASTLRMTPAKLDLMLWYLQTGEIAK
ncbi:N-glycosylase/DNA lyase [Candidatus Pacearchaeota archaeon]|nr:N-glycosylase/DNA lyase [Candidatus Pacearchaeota archaeon]